MACLLLCITLTMPARGANLLEGSPVLLRLDKPAGDGKWVPSVSFGEATRHDLRLRVEFEVGEIRATPVLTLRTPRHISEWILNGQPLIGPPKDMKLKDNPHSKIFRSEYNFLVFEADERTCEMKAWTFGGLQTPDNERKLELVDRRVWEPRKQAAGDEQR